MLKKSNILINLILTISFAASLINKSSRVVMMSTLSNSVSSSSTTATTTKSKEIIIIRHGTTEMNEVLSKTSWGSKGFVDANLWDTRLSRRGIEDAQSLNKKVLQKDSDVGDFSRIDLLICSPLTRALQTAEIGLKGDIIRKDIAKIVHPLCRERLYLSSDVGRTKTALRDDYPNWNYDYLPETDWWYCHPKDEEYIEWRPEGKYPCEGEIESYFIDRIKKLKKFLNERDEQCIAVVCHWGVARALTGKSLSKILSLIIMNIVIFIIINR